MPMEKKDVCLTLENVSKVFAKVESDEVTHALQDVSVTMKSGEFVSLVGPSGCGKSTILRLVAGLILPTLGRVAVNGEEIEAPAPERFRNDYPAQLSGGMAQRVALVRTLINEPEILLLDEPLGALDEFTRMNMQDEILNIWSQRKQLALMVTHSIDEAVYMGTRVLVMESTPGRIVADIRIDEDFPRDRSSANFVEYRNEILNRLHFGGRKD